MRTKRNAVVAVVAAGAMGLVGAGAYAAGTSRTSTPAAQPISLAAASASAGLGSTDTLGGSADGIDLTSIASMMGMTAGKGRAGLGGRLGHMALAQPQLHEALVQLMTTGHIQITTAITGGSSATFLATNGAITAASATGLTVKATDGMSFTWVVNGDTVIGKRLDTAEVSKLKVGTQVIVLGEVSGSTNTAKFVAKIPTVADFMGRKPGAAETASPAAVA